MFDAIRRMFAAAPAGPDWRMVSGWARAQRYAFKQVPEAGGFAVDGSFGETPWRLEWGPPQRRYISTRELRIRMEMSRQQELQMMVLSRSLLDLLEQETFEDFTQGNQTYVGSSVPEEMRWLAMWPRAGLAGPRELRQGFAALGAHPELAAAWIDGALGERLLAATEGLLQDQPPFMLMCQRGRLYLRMELPEAGLPAIAEALAVFAVAAQQLLRLDGGEAAAQAWVDSTAANLQAIRSGRVGAG